MKKIIFILAVVFSFISCGNNVNSLVCNEDVIEYNDTLKIGEIFISRSEKMSSNLRYLTPNDFKIEIVNDSVCIVNYSSKDNILHITYNGNTYNRYNTKIDIKKNIIEKGYKFDDISFYTVDNNEIVYLILNCHIYETHNVVMYSK